MTDLEKAARMALEALEALEQWNTPLYKRGVVITALRQALSNSVEQPQDEWLTGCPECGMDGECGCDKKSEKVDPCVDGSCSCCWTNLEEQPAQQQEPVAKVVLTETLKLPCLQWLDLVKQFDFKGGEFLYLSPQSKQWVGLTDEERNTIYKWLDDQPFWRVVGLTRAIEAKLKEKNS